MRFRKSIVSALVGACLLTAPLTSFADPPQPARTLSDNEFYSGYLNASGEQDWYKWTNNTGKDVWNFDIYVYTPTWENYDIIAAFPRTDGSFNYYEALDHGSGANGGFDHFKAGHVGKGYTVYWKVVGHTRNDFSTTKNYFTWSVPQ